MHDVKSPSSSAKGRIFLVGIAAVVVAGAAPFLWTSEGTAVAGMTVDGSSVGGMTAGEISRMIDERHKKLDEGVLTVEHKAVKEEWKFKDLKVHADSQAEAAAVLARGRSGNLAKDWYERWRILMTGQDEPADVTWDEKALDGKIKALRERYGAPPEDALPRLGNDGSVTFSKGRPFMKIDSAQLKADAEKALAAGKSASVSIPASEEKLPSLSEEETKQINRILSVYTTHFPQDPNRSFNIKLAASKIDHKVIAPGEGFSFNAATGLRTAAAGYKDAPVFMDGKLVPDAGGGVCQVSTTLFNAVLLAGLAVTERTSHFGPVAYVPIGRDATVADHSLDFRFRNNLKHPVYIRAVYSPGALTMYILGNDQDEPLTANITEENLKEIPNKTIFKADPNQQEDQKMEEGNKGYQLSIRQSVKRRDGTAYSDTFYSDYEAVDDVITFKDPAKKAEAEAAAAEKAADPPAATEA